MQALVMKAFEYMKLLDPGFAGVKKQVVSESQLANEGQVGCLTICLNYLVFVLKIVICVMCMITDPCL